MKTEQVFIHTFAILSYFLAMILLAKQYFKFNTTVWISRFLKLAIFLQSIGYAYMAYDYEYIALSSIDVISITLLFLVTIIFYLNRKNNTLHLLLTILPVNIFILIVAITHSQEAISALDLTNRSFIHVFLSIFSCDLLIIATLQALFLGIQEYLLHNHHHLLPLPALEIMENLLFKLLYMGVIFLSCTLLSGLIFSINDFHAGIIYKTILTLLAWLFFVGLLFGRLFFGWRGYTATYLILAGSLFLAIAVYDSWKNFYIAYGFS